MAVHSTPHLAGDTNRRALPAAPRDFIPGFTAVAGLAPIALRHPHRLHALSVSAGQQIAHRPIVRCELPLNAWRPDRDPELAQAAAKIPRQGRDVVSAFNSLLVQGFEKLVRPVRGLLQFFNQGGELVELESEERLLCLVSHAM